MVQRIAFSRRRATSQKVARGFNRRREDEKSGTTCQTFKVEFGMPDGKRPVGPDADYQVPIPIRA